MIHDTNTDLVKNFVDEHPEKRSIELGAKSDQITNFPDVTENLLHNVNIE